VHTELGNKVSESKDVYLSQKDIAEKSDIRIEEAMLTFERGEMDIDRIQ
jgi:hypothetical protein